MVEDKYVNLIFVAHSFYVRYHLHFPLSGIWWCRRNFGSETLAWTQICGSRLDLNPVLEVLQQKKQKSPPLPLYVKIQRVSFHCHLYCVILLSSVVICLVCQAKLMWHHKYNPFFLPLRCCVIVKMADTEWVLVIMWWKGVWGEWFKRGEGILR